MEYALQKEHPQGWLTVSRHASATAASEAMYADGGLLRREKFRIVGVAASEIVRVNAPDRRPRPTVIGTFPEG